VVATFSTGILRLWRWFGLAAALVVIWAGLVWAEQEPSPPAPAPLPPLPPPVPGANLPGETPPVSPERPAEPVRGALPLPGLRAPRSAGEFGRPGMPERGERPIPGSIFDPGASGPGIGRSGSEMFLGGALDVRSGWPFVWLDHFKPRAERVSKLWIVQTRDCPQEMGTDPWACLKVLHFDEEGWLVERGPMDLLAQAAGRPVFIQVQGSLTTPDIALGGLLWTNSWLTHARTLSSDVVIVAFDWPSQRVYRNDFRDINEKGRRAYVAGFHLARFVQQFPPESRICLLGQSYGGRVVTSALHLLGGGCLNSQDRDPPVSLESLRSDLHVRAVILGAASDHDWLDPGRRLDHALLGCEALLNLYNRRDEALFLYPFLIRSGHRHALGRVGLHNRDLDRLGPLAARYTERDVHDLLSDEHTLLDAVANPVIARLIAPYVWSPDPGPSPALTAPSRTRSLRRYERRDFWN